MEFGQLFRAIFLPERPGTRKNSLGSAPEFYIEFQRKDSKRNSENYYGEYLIFSLFLGLRFKIDFSEKANESKICEWQPASTLLCSMLAFASSGVQESQIHFQTSF